MPATHLGFSLAEALSDAERIKTQRHNLANAKVEAGYKVEDRASAKAHNVMVGKARGKATAQGGTDQDWSDLSAIDPKGAAEMRKLYDGMTEQQRERFREQNEKTASMAVTVLNSKQENKNEMYKTFLELVPESVAKEFPSEYNESTMRVAVSGMAAVDKVMGAPSVVTQGTQDNLYNKAGVFMGSKTNPNKLSEKAGKDGKGGPKYSDLLREEKQMYDQAHSILGGTFITGPNGEREIGKLDPTLAPKVQAIFAKALSLWRAGKVIDRAEAVSKAAALLGTDIPESRDDIKAPPAAGTPEARMGDPMNLGNY